MKVRTATLLLLGTCVPSLAPAAAPAASGLRWSAGLFGRSTDDSLSTSKTAGAGFSLDFEKILAPSLYTHFQGGVRLEAGSSSALFTDEFKPESRLTLQDARLRWTVVGPFSLSAGALSQELLASPLLVAGGTFPALLASVRGESGRWYGEGHAQGAIPTGTGLTIKNTGKENTPSLLSFTALTGWRKNQDYFLEARATHFRFRDLTHGIAQDSRFYGNTVTGIAAGSSFVYRYQGFEVGGAGSLPLSSRFALTGGGSFVRNPEAPAASNSGQYAYGGFTWIGSGWRLSPLAEWYRNEADAAPAFYTSREFGHNNRRGAGATLRLRLQDPGVELSLRARRADLIDPQPFQRNDFKFIEFNLGLPHAPF